MSDCAAASAKPQATGCGLAEVIVSGEACPVLAMAKKSNSFLGWLGRQVGYVRTAVRTDVAPPATPADPDKSNVLYRKSDVAELPHPDDEKLMLRRTTIDEVIDRQDSPRSMSDDHDPNDPKA
jgi:hypothetical protein